MRSGSLLYYDPDGWSHDPHQWWAPLTDLAAGSDVASRDWRRVLGVEEFFDKGLLGQTQVLTSWVCLVAAAAAASAARAWARGTAGARVPRGGADHAATVRTGAGAGTAGAGTANAGAVGATTRAVGGTSDAAILAVGALEMAAALQQLRWQGRRVGEGLISTRVLVELGRAALKSAGFPGRVHGRSPAALWLLAGWLAHCGSEPPAPITTGGVLRDDGPVTARQAVARAAQAAFQRWGHTSALDWGTAHLVERLVVGVIDDPGPGATPGAPAQAWANVLLAAGGHQPGSGEVGAFEARRQRSSLVLPPGLPVPDLARLAFLHADEEFAGSIADALHAACRVRAPAGSAELVSWAVQLRLTGYPLAERVVTGPSASLGAYVAFRSLAEPGASADDSVAFTGQVLADGSLRAVGGASGKIAAARDRRIRVVVHPRGMAWRDPRGRLNLVSAGTAEDAVHAAAAGSASLRMYLEAARHLIAPEPWLQAWLDSKGPQGAQMPLLDVTARHVRGHQSKPPAHADGKSPGVLARQQTGVSGSQPAGPAHREPEVAACPAHLLARSYPDYSFVISAGGGCGKTIAAKRIVADAAGQALDALNPRPGHHPGTVTIPLYLPLGELPANWDELVRASVAALPQINGSHLEIGAALTAAFTGATSLCCRPLVVVDGTHWTRSDENLDRHKVRELVALVAANPGSKRGAGWWPERASQVVLCGRSESRRHQRAAEALRRERPGWMVTMGLDPLSDSEIDRFVTSLSGREVPAASRPWSLVSNPLLLALSVVAGGADIDSDPADVFDRGINVLLDGNDVHRGALAEIAFRAASARLAPVGDFTLTDIAAPAARDVVADALAHGDTLRAWAMALDHDERDAFEHAERATHLLSAAGRGWRFFHDRAFAFLVADRIARRALTEPSAADELFGTLAPHLGHPLWADTLEATGRLLELRARMGRAGGPVESASGGDPAEPG